MTQINLIPASILASLQRRIHLKRWLVPLGVALSSVLVMMWVTISQRAEASEVRVQTEQIVTQVVSSQEQLHVSRTKTQQLHEQKKRADALRRKRAWSHVLDVVAQSLPPSVWLTSISTDPSAPSTIRQKKSSTLSKVDAKNISDVVTIDAARKLRILGYAAHPGEPHELVKQLNISGVFESVSLVQSRRQSVLDGSYFRFEVICTW